MLVASLSLGLWSLLDFAVEVGAFNQDDLIETLNRFTTELVEVVNHNNESVMGGNIDVTEELLDQIRSLVASRRATIDPDDSRGATLIGNPSRLQSGEKVLLLNHKTVGRMLGKGDNGRAVSGGLAKSAIRNEKGSVTRKGRIGGTPTQCVAIPWEVWDPDWTDSGTNSQQSTNNSQMF